MRSLKNIIIELGKIRSEQGGLGMDFSDDVLFEQAVKIYLFELNTIEKEPQ